MKWTLPGIRRLREAVERGETDAQIAAAIGTTPKSVEACRHAYGIKRPHGGGRKPGTVVAGKWDAQIAELFALHYSDRAIAEECGCSIVTVEKRRRVMGFYRPRGGTVSPTDPNVSMILTCRRVGWGVPRLQREFKIGKRRLKRILEQA